MWRMLGRGLIAYWKFRRLLERFWSPMRAWLLRYGDGLLRFTIAAGFAMLTIAMLVSPGQITSQDIDRRLDEFAQEQRRMRWLNFAEALAWIAALMGSIWALKQKGVETVRAVWSFTRLAVSVPIHVKQLIEGQALMRGMAAVLDHRVRLVEDHQSIASFVADEMGRWTYVTDGLADLIGGYPSELMSWGWKVRIDGRSREAVFAEWLKAVGNHEPFSHEFYFQHESGQRVKVAVVAYPVKDARGQAAGYVGSARKLQGTGEAPSLSSQ